MGVPYDYGGLKGRWIAGAQLLNADGDPVGDGDEISSVTDQSGNGHHLLQATSNKRPLWRADQLNGHAAYYFDGANDVVISNVVMSQFATNSAFTVYVVLRMPNLQAGGTTGTNRPGIWAAELGAMGMLINGDTKALRAYLSDGTGTTDVDTVNDSFILGQPLIVSMKHDSGTCYISANGGTPASFVVGLTSPGVGTASNFLAIGRNYTSAGTVRYLELFLFDFFIYEEARTTQEDGEILEYLRQVYGLNPVPPLREQVRTCLTAKLLDNRVAQDALPQHEIPLWVALDNDPMDPVGFAHADWPHPTGLGAGSIDWRRRIMELQGVDIQPMARRATANLYDKRRFVATEFARYRTLEAQSGGTAEGVAQLGMGPTRYFTRASEAWVDSPAGDGSVVRVDVGVWALDVDGLLLQRARQNYQPRSSFVSETTGLPALGGSGSRSFDSTVLLFNPNDQGAPQKTLRLQADATITVAVDQPMPITGGFGSSDNVVVSVDCRNASAAAPGTIDIKRDIDGKFFRKSDGTWQVSQPFNPVAGAAGAWVRWESGVMVPGASGTAKLTAHLGVPTSGVGGQVNNWGHVQIEIGTSASSRIVTDAAIAARAADVYTIPNNASPGRSLPAAPFSFVRKVKLKWPSTDTAEHYHWEAYLDANNWARLRWGGGGALVFELRAAGVTYTTSRTGTHLVDDEVLVAVRWASASGEEDLAPYSIQCAVKGVWSTPVVAAPYGSSLPATATLYVGSDRTGAKQLDGSIIEETILPFVISDDELLRDVKPGFGGA